MKYYRLIFKTEKGKVLFSEILDGELTQEQFEQMNWDAPIVRHEIADHVHFLSLDPQYLDAILLGVGTYQKMSEESEQNV